MLLLHIQGNYAIGMLKGPSPFEMSPVVRPDGKSNPVFGCTIAPDIAFTADPFLFRKTENEW